MGLISCFCFINVEIAESTALKASKRRPFAAGQKKTIASEANGTQKNL